MFDTVSGGSEIEITGLSFRSDTGLATVTIYTVAGAYSAALTDIGDWTQIASVSIDSAGKQAFVSSRTSPFLPQLKIIVVLNIVQIGTTTRSILPAR